MRWNHGSARFRQSDAPKAGNQNIIQVALVETGGDQTRVAERLGLQRTHLVKLLRALKIREPSGRIETSA